MAQICPAHEENVRTTQIVSKLCVYRQKVMVRMKRIEVYWPTALSFNEETICFIFDRLKADVLT